MAVPAGHTTIVVQNMVGGGGIRAANFLYNVAPRTAACSV